MAAGQAETLETEARSLGGELLDPNVDDEHDPEGSTLAYERSRATTLLAAAWRRLEDLDRALNRFESGNYGTCELCGTEIPQERLDALPAVGTCMRCSSAGSGEGQTLTSGCLRAMPSGHGDRRRRPR